MQRIILIVGILAVSCSFGFAQNPRSVQKAVETIAAKPGPLSAAEIRQIERNIMRLTKPVYQSPQMYPTVLTPVQVLREDPEALLFHNSRQYVLTGLKDLLKKDAALLELVTQIEKKPPTNYITAHDVRRELWKRLGQASFQGNYALESALAQQIMPNTVLPNDLVYVPFTHSSSVAYVGPRQWVLGTPGNLPEWVGMLDTQEAVGVIILVKRDGKVIQSGLTVIDAKTDLKRSADFFYSATYVSTTDQTEVYVLSQNSPWEQVQRVVQFVRGISPDETLYYMDLHSPGRAALNTQTGKISTDFGWEDMAPSQQLEKDFDSTGKRWNHPISHWDLRPGEIMQQWYPQRFGVQSPVPPER